MRAETQILSGDVVSINLRILEIQRRYRDVIARELPAPVCAQLPATYILETVTLPFAPHLFREICLRLIPLLQESNPEADYVPLLSRLDDEILWQLAGAVQHSPEPDLAMALDLAVREVRIDKLPVPEADALRMLFLAALMPFFSAFARQQTGIDLSRWQQGWCPVCGQYPVNGFNRPQDGRRILGCWLCETQWAYTRFTCPVCGCRGKDGQLLLVPRGGDRRRRIQVCEECRHYLKITDCTQAGSGCDLQLENSATIHLDVLAQRQGYRPASHYRLLIQ
ncbi:MAG TPA: formate dehydrogenase accessory protein FdhE [Bacillota bacterium]|nr:formate dehydrogenase accessory protein FdhE [Bacillota bacterium]